MSAGIARASRYVAIAAALLLLVPGTSMSTARADQEGGTLSNDLDAELYASDFAVSVDEAERRLRLQGELSALIGNVEASAPNTFAGGWTQHMPTYRVVLAFTADTPESRLAVDLASGAPAPVWIRTDAQYSLADLARARDDLAASLAAERDVIVDADVPNGALWIIHTGVDEDLSTRISAASRRSEVPVNEQIVPVPETPAHTYGGMKLSSCTTGFTARDNNTGLDGFITAGHCGDTQTYYEMDGTSYGTTFKNDWWDPWRDMQFHTTSHVEYAKFQTTTGTLRSVSGWRGRADQQLGDYVCHRGKTTGYSCGTIVSKTHAPSYAGACGGQTCQPVWIKVEGSSLACWGGDSGGPWFSGKTALGIHSSNSSSGTAKGECYFSVYSAINYAFTVPNLALLTE
jgi:streptogrisin C